MTKGRKFVIVLSTFIGCTLLLSLLFNEKQKVEEIANIADLENDNRGNTISEPLGWPWKGVVISTHYDFDTDKDLTTLKNNGVNFVKIYLKPRKLAKSLDVSEEVGLELGLAQIDKILDKCKQLNLYAMIYFSEFPIGTDSEYTQNNKEFWEDSLLLRESKTKIKEVIHHFKNRGDELQAYQFIGEPVSLDKEGKATRPEEWDNFFLDIYSILKSEDNYRYLLYTPGLWGGPQNYKDFEPLKDDSKIIYSFHYYAPHKYSHQGIGNELSFSYPGYINFAYWDKERIESSLQAVIKFKEKFNRKILVGEFSAVYNAEGWENYLKDQLEIYTEKDFGYTYFTFNGWKGWALSDKNESAISHKNFGIFDMEEREKRLELLSEFWIKN